MQSLRTAGFYEELKRELLAALPELGIDKLGIASTEPFTELKQRLIRHRELGYESGFEEPDLDKRTDPSLLFDKPQSIIAIAIAYPSKLKDAPSLSLEQGGAYWPVLLGGMTIIRCCATGWRGWSSG